MTRISCLLAVALAVLTGCGGNKETAPKPPTQFAFGIVFTEVPPGLREGAPVRIAGIDVGRVTGIEPSGLDKLVRVAVQRSTRFALHTDATAKLRPRIFRRGEWFVDLFPGTRRAALLTAGQQIAGLKSP